MFGFIFLAPYARTTRYGEAFFSLENQGKKRSFRSRASLQAVDFWCCQLNGFVQTIDFDG